MATPQPGIGDWYRLNDGALFEVVALDDDDGTIEIQYFDGTVEEMDIEDWEAQWEDGALILCSSHGALFEKDSGYCVAGPCAGRALTPVALEVRSGFVLLADDVDVSALAVVLTDAAP